MLIPALLEAMASFPNLSMAQSINRVEPSRAVDSFNNGEWTGYFSFKYDRMNGSNMKTNERIGLFYYCSVSTNTSMKPCQLAMADQNGTGE